MAQDYIVSSGKRLPLLTHPALAVKVLSVFTTCARIKLHSFPSRIDAVRDFENQTAELSSLFHLALCSLPRKEALGSWRYPVFFYVPSLTDWIFGDSLVLGTTTKTHKPLTDSRAVYADKEGGVAGMPHHCRENKCQELVPHARENPMA